MSKKFLIAGSIVDTDADRWTFEDVTPTQVNSFLKTLDDGEEVEIDITSFGGSVTAGLAICNMLKQASANGHKTTAHVIGIAASMASAIACACDELKIDANAFLMIHNPYTVMMGNANEMRKEADNLDMFRDALLAIYRTKFDMSDDLIKSALDEETWILGEHAKMFNLKAEVIPTEEPLKIAASLKKPKFFAKFNHAPEALREKTMEDNKEVEEKKANEVEDTIVEDTVVGTPVENEKVEDSTEKASVVEEPVKNEVENHIEEQDEQIEELAKEVEDANSETVEEVVEEETIPKAECDKRVSGMQSAMAKQMNDLKKDYEAKIEDFKNQLSTKDKELIDAQAKITSLEDSVETFKKDNGELSQRISALLSDVEEKTSALAKLNASVNTPNETFNWKNLKGKQFFDYVRKHPELVK